MKHFATLLVIICALAGVNCIDFSNPTGKKIDPSAGSNSLEKVASNSSAVLTHIPEQILTCFKGYTQLGCFENIEPWVSLLRPFPPPMDPKDINVKLYLYTSDSPSKEYNVKLWDDISIEGPAFNISRNYTAFITHGFLNNGNISWMHEMKDGYLKRRDANVFIVDWGKGASILNYLQACANTRVVGAELKRFADYLVNSLHLDPARLHFMGHSLGAHISSYAAKGVPGVGQITAFDPAQPGFEGCPSEVRLTKTDAKFVDVIHSNIKPTIPLMGFGMIEPLGHIDYYMNGGLSQPGCNVPPAQEANITSIVDLGKFSVEVIGNWVACSHNKAYMYYTEALLNDYCTFWGRKSGVFGIALDITTLGKAGLVLEKFEECKLDTCSPIGVYGEEYPARGVFAVNTNADSPFCHDDPKITEKMRELKNQAGNGHANSEHKNPLKTILKEIVG